LGTRKHAGSDTKVQQGKQRDEYFSKLRRGEAARAARLARGKDGSAAPARQA
jgi:hypothetical protein